MRVAILYHNYCNDGKMAATIATSNVGTLMELSRSEW